MGILLMILGMGFLLLGVISLVDPKIGLFWAKFMVEKTRLKACIINFAMFLFIMIIVAIAFPDVEKKIDNANNKLEAINNGMEKEENKNEKVVEKESESQYDGKSYIEEKVLGELTEGVTYEKVQEITGGNGELVLDRYGVKTYSYYKKEKPLEEIRIAYEEGKIIMISDVEADKKALEESMN